MIYDGKALGEQLRAMLRSWFQFEDATRVATVTLVASAPVAKTHAGDVENAMAVVELNIDQQVTFTLDPRDRAGNPARLDGVPTWAAENTTVLALEPSADGLTCVARSTDLTGETTVTATCDADLDVGEERIILGVATVVVGSGEAQVVELVAGAPEPKPPA
jgi:hypothetical protein